MDTPGTAAGRTLTLHPAGWVSFGFVCPFPPSTNNLFGTVFTGRGKMLRAASKAYKAWRAEAASACDWLCWPEGNHAKWELRIRLHDFPHTGDVSNRIKAIEDLIVAHTGLDDAYCDDVRAVRCRGWERGKVAEVEVKVWGWLLTEEA